MSLRQGQLDPIKGALSGLYILDCKDPNAILTGTVVETELTRILVPAGLLGDSGGFKIYALFTSNNSVGAKNVNMYFGGQQFFQLGHEWCKYRHEYV